LDQKPLNSLPDWGKCKKARGKASHGVVTDGVSGKDLSAMRVMFWTWAVVIASGLVYYTVIGLSHR
jgi:hypothetical protein